MLHEATAGKMNMLYNSQARDRRNVVQWYGRETVGKGDYRDDVEPSYNSATGTVRLKFSVSIIKSI